MAWELKGKPVTQKVTAKIAQEFMDMEAAHVDRPLSERRLQVYSKIREAGGFRPVTWARAYCKETEQFLRVNGKHTSTLFSDGKKLDNIYVTIEDYDCDTLEDVAKLYATFDSQAQTRNATDINLSFAAVIPELAKLNGKVINLLVSALNYRPTESGVNIGASSAEKAEVLFDNIPICLWVAEIVYPEGNTHTSTHIRRVPVAAAMIACYNKSQKAAREFWEAVRDETGPKPELPDRKLAKFLSTTAAMAGGGRSGVPSRFRIKAREYYVKSIIAWNAWRRSEATNLRYYLESKVPSAV